MKMLRKGLLGLITVMGLTSCGGANVDEITLVVYEDKSNIEVLRDWGDTFTANYKKQHPLAPKITIEWVQQAEASAIEKMQNENPTGNGPDIAAVTHDTIINGANSGIISPITFDYEVKALMSEDALNAVSKVADNGNKTLYGYPITAESQVIMYNKDELQASDLESFDTLLASGKKIAIKESKDPNGYYNFGFFTDSVVFGEDGTDKSSVNLQTPNAVANLVKFYHDYHSTVLDLSPDESVSSLTSKQVAGVLSSPYYLATVKKALGEDKVGVHVLPKINGENQRPLSGYKAYVVNSYSRYPAIANELAKFLVSPDVQWQRLHSLNYLPSLAEENFTSDIREEIEGNPINETFLASLAMSRRMPSIDAMSNFWSPTNRVIGDFWSNNRGTITEAIVKSGLTEIENAIKQ